MDAQYSCTTTQDVRTKQDTRNIVPSLYIRPAATLPARAIADPFRHNFRRYFFQSYSCNSAELNRRTMLKFCPIRPKTDTMNERDIIRLKQPTSPLGQCLAMNSVINAV